MFIICSKKSKVNFYSICYPWHAKILLNLISLPVHCSMVTIIFVVMLHMPMYSGCFGCYKKYSRHPCCFGLTTLKIFGFKLIYANLYFPFELYLAFFKVIYLKIKSFIKQVKTKKNCRMWKSYHKKIFDVNHVTAIKVWRRQGWNHHPFPTPHICLSWGNTGMIDTSQCLNFSTLSLLAMIKHMLGREEILFCFKEKKKKKNLKI